jgi:hypothetical protein
VPEEGCVASAALLSVFVRLYQYLCFLPALPSVFVLLYQHFRQYLCICTSTAASICAFVYLSPAQHCGSTELSGTLQVPPRLRRLSEPLPPAPPLLLLLPPPPHALVVR